MLEKTITYFDTEVRVVCDGKCWKAWGHNGGRPRIQFGDPEENPDDHAMLADHEVGIAPDDPGTYEGGHGKPTAYDNPEDHLLNKWCVRECERSGMFGTKHGDYPPPDFSQRVYNMPSKHPESVAERHKEVLEAFARGDRTGVIDITGLSDEELIKVLSS